MLTSSATAQTSLPSGTMRSNTSNSRPSPFTAANLQQLLAGAVADPAWRPAGAATTPADSPFHSYSSAVTTFLSARETGLTNFSSVISQASVAVGDVASAAPAPARRGGRYSKMFWRKPFSSSHMPADCGKPAKSPTLSTPTHADTAALPAAVEVVPVVVRAPPTTVVVLESSSVSVGGARGQKRSMWGSSKQPFAVWVLTTCVRSCVPRSSRSNKSKRRPSKAQPAAAEASGDKKIPAAVGVLPSAASCDAPTAVIMLPAMGSIKSASKGSSTSNNKKGGRLAKRLYSFVCCGAPTLAEVETLATQPTQPLKPSTAVGSEAAVAAEVAAEAAAAAAEISPDLQNDDAAADDDAASACAAPSAAVPEATTAVSPTAFSSRRPLDMSQCPYPCRCTYNTNETRMVFCSEFCAAFFNMPYVPCAQQPV